MSSLTQFARACAVERAAIVNTHRDRVMRDPAENPIHNFRVALRRIEQVFDLFDIEPLAFDLAAAKDQMKAWMQAAGRVRDCDVVMPLLQPPWTNDLLAYRRQRASALLDVLAATVPMPSPPHRIPKSPLLTADVALFASFILPRQAKAYFAAGHRAASKTNSLRRLHEFRLHGKNMRYSLEIFAGLYGPRLAGLHKMLKRTQQLLGEMADARAALKLLKKMNAPSSVLEPLKKLANDKRDAFAVRWFEEVNDEQLAAKWVEYLRRFAKPNPALTPSG